MYMFHFQYIEFLWALAVIPLMVLLYVLVVRQKKITIKKIGDPILVNQLIKDYIPGKVCIDYGRVCNRCNCIG
jgi:Ca-activated chloride channel family protein